MNEFDRGNSDLLVFISLKFKSTVLERLIDLILVLRWV